MFDTNEVWFAGKIMDKSIDVKPVGNSKVLNLRLGNKRSYRGRDKETKHEYVYISCEAWASGAEKIAQEFKPGDYILVKGRLRENSWDDKEGKKHKDLRIRIEKFSKLIESEAEQPQSQSQSEPAEAPPSRDIPF